MYVCMCTNYKGQKKQIQSACYKCYIHNRMMYAYCMHSKVFMFLVYASACSVYSMSDVMIKLTKNVSNGKL